MVLLPYWFQLQPIFPNQKYRELLMEELSKKHNSFYNFFFWHNGEVYSNHLGYFLLRVSIFLPWLFHFYLFARLNKIVWFFIWILLLFLRNRFFWKILFFSSRAYLASLKPLIISFIFNFVAWSFDVPNYPKFLLIDTLVEK